MKIQYFDHVAQKVNIDGITFDSKLEASMYRVLRKYKNLIEIKVHSPIITGWKVDFDLIPRSYNGVLLLHRLECVTGVAYPSRILLEVKGITDKNFIARFGQIVGTNFENILLLASRQCDAIGYLDPTPGSKRVLTKPIVPITLIRDILAGTK